MAIRVDVLPEEHRSSFKFFQVSGPRHSLAIAPIQNWLDDEGRPGFYAWGGRWLASEGNFSPRDCIEVAITDPLVAFEFKVRWV